MTPTDQEQKDALEFVERGVRRFAEDPASYLPSDGKALQTLKAMLAEPRLPKEPTPEILDAINGALYTSILTTTATSARDRERVIYRALYAHLTKGRQPVEVPARPSSGLPVHVDIATDTNPNHVIERIVEVLVREGKMTVGGAIGARINERIGK